jgi:hypothetical protein
MDKDTWVIENLVPKNEAPRRLRKNVTVVDVFKATRKIKFTLCVMGYWAIFMPPYNIARLSALTREAGYHTRIFDFNIDTYYDLMEADPEMEGAYKPANYWWWQDQHYYKVVHPTYEPILRKYIDKILEEDVDILGFSLYYTNLLATKWVITEIKKRKPDITIIVGGPECTEGHFTLPEGVDYYFVGESEQNILDFLGNWENGIKPTEPKIGSLYSDMRIDIDSLPYPDYSDFDLTKYWSKNAICAEISRGCVAKCTYCSEVWYWKFRDRGAQTVVDELEYQVKTYGVQFVSFVDSLMNGNLKEFRRFCEELVKRNLGITWWGYARIDGRMDLEFYKLMKAAGCQGFNYGIESGSDKVLVAVNKKNTVAEINQNLIDSEIAGMKVNACWVIGAPGEDIEAVTHSLNLLWNHRSRIAAVSPGPGLGDNMGSAYDDREKFNISERNASWLGGWYTLDMLNTKLHRHIRIKSTHIWLQICEDFGGTMANVHSVGDITKHYDVKFDSEYINDQIVYENFDYNIIQSGLGVFADSVMNEIFGLLRILWRVRGGYEINIRFNSELDHADFIFAIAPDTHTFVSDIWFKIDDLGNYAVKNYYKFENKDKQVKEPNFEYTFENNGKWSESTKTQARKVFFIKQERIEKGLLPLESSLSSVSIPERFALREVAKNLDAGSVVVDAYAGLGGRACIMSHSNKQLDIHSIERFDRNSLKEEFDNMEPWLWEQLVELCTTTQSNHDPATKLLNGIKDNFTIDPTGEQSWKFVTEKYSNIHLNKINNITDLVDWNKEVDVCILKIYDENELDQHIKFWSKHIKTTGTLIAHPFNKNLSAAIFKKFNELIETDWKVVKQEDNMIFLQRKIIEA